MYLQRIEGQVRGIAGMVRGGRRPIEIIQQISAVRGALARAQLDVLREYVSAEMQRATPLDRASVFTADLRRIVAGLGRRSRKR